MALTTRFAPSPTGLLHIGHAASALMGWSLARAHGGRFKLRIEDIDTARCRESFVAAIVTDLEWLGIDWDGPVWRQSARLGVYADGLERLRALGVVYPCVCTRADIAAAGRAPHEGEGAVYPGLCRGGVDPGNRAPAWRIDVERALAITGPLMFIEKDHGAIAADPGRLGDFVVARRDIGTSYTLAVVMDDAAQGVTDVVRGADLLEATHGQRLLQALLGLPPVRYHHHPLWTGQDGRRLAKRDGAPTLAAMRADGVDPAVLRSRLLVRAAAETRGDSQARGGG